MTFEILNYYLNNMKQAIPIIEGGPLSFGDETIRPIGIILEQDGTLKIIALEKGDAPRDTEHPPVRTIQMGNTPFDISLITRDPLTADLGAISGTGTALSVIRIMLSGWKLPKDIGPLQLTAFHAVTIVLYGTYDRIPEDLIQCQNEFCSLATPASPHTPE